MPSVFYRCVVYVQRATEAHAVVTEVFTPADAYEAYASAGVGWALAGKPGT